MNNFYTNERNIQIIISLLKKHNIKKVIASPGTTHISFLGSIQSDPYFEIYSSVDERSEISSFSPHPAIKKKSLFHNDFEEYIVSKFINLIPGIYLDYFKKMSVFFYPVTLEFIQEYNAGRLPMMSVNNYEDIPNCENAIELDSSDISQGTGNVIIYTCMEPETGKLYRYASY